MRLGGPIMKEFADPGQWAALVREMGYSAVFFPVDHTAEPALIAEYAKLARENGWIIAEVGAWSNPLAKDPAIAGAALHYCQKQLALADEVGACCCVNIAGSIGDKWDGPDRNSFSTETFSRVVDSVRSIIDAVKPTRTFYALETMPWMLPDSADTYRQLIAAIDRPRFAVHFDPVNIINSPRAFYQNSQILDEFFDKLGPEIKSCHAKDILLEDHLTTHLNEKIPGEGQLDFVTYLTRLNQLHPDTPIMLEHLEHQAAVEQAAAHVRKIAADLGIQLTVR